jgi:uncharacterized YigZ family protein
MEEYLTLRREAQAGFTERRSRFVGAAKPVGTEEEAADFIRAVRAGNRDARHNAFAFLLRGGRTARCSDDGEPQGTAGVPILNVLRKAAVADAAVVVTRYFGGVLLGAGGLVRAYSHAASLALSAAGTVRMGACFTAKLRCGYGRYGAVLPLIAKHGGGVDGVSYSGRVEICFHIPCGTAAAFQAALADATCGECRASLGGKTFYALS